MERDTKFSVVKIKSLYHTTVIYDQNSLHYWRALRESSGVPEPGWNDFHHDLSVPKHFYVNSECVNEHDVLYVGMNRVLIKYDLFRALNVFDFRGNSELVDRIFDQNYADVMIILRNVDGIMYIGHENHVCIFLKRPNDVICKTENENIIQYSNVYCNEGEYCKNIDNLIV